MGTGERLKIERGRFPEWNKKQRVRRKLYFFTFYLSLKSFCSQSSSKESRPFPKFLAKQKERKAGFYSRETSAPRNVWKYGEEEAVNNLLRGV